MITGYVKYDDGKITEIDSIDDIPDVPLWNDRDFRAAIENDPHGTFYGDVIDFTI